MNTLELSNVELSADLEKKFADRKAETTLVACLYIR